MNDAHVSAISALVEYLIGLHQDGEYLKPINVCICTGF